MAEPNEDIDLVIEEDKKPDSELEIVIDDKAGEKKPDTKIIEPEEGLQRLKNELERERSERVAAEKRARDSDASAVRARNDVQDSNLSLVTNAIETVKQTQDVLKSRLSACYAAGDWDGAADVQSEMSTNSAKLLQLETGKQALESAPKVEPEKRQEDPVEALCSQLSSRSASWVRAHPEYARDPKKLNKMVAAHNLVVDDYTVDSDDYFGAIERTLGIGKKADREIETDDAMSEAARHTERRAAPPAAPVTRQIGDSNGQKPNTVRLTAAEREMAIMMKSSNQSDRDAELEYARNKVALKKEGRLQ